ncbi:hypothetical protein BLA17378_07987 [Burkholderia aenigmatica]|uniref:Uncharacterized protein n=1 Tax=Burkholderia aenigmatica TaxID=2015348 RepID=A0ABY6Y9A0_9BURK|nr:hypothetical protein BLA17378_07987 [Burkholderia aenigmatica]
MTEPIISDDEIDAIYERVHAEWEVRNKCAPNLWVAFAAAVLEKYLEKIGDASWKAARRDLTQSKPLAGARAFEALGRRAQALGQPMTLRGKGNWPDWARSAYVRGHVSNAPWRTVLGANSIVKESKP